MKTQNKGGFSLLQTKSLNDESYIPSSIDSILPPLYKLFVQSFFIAILRYDLG